VTYRISYIDTSATLAEGVRTGGAVRNEDFPTELAALARARELLEDVHCHSILVGDDMGERIGGVRLQLKAGIKGE
jgi:hypothetical protein